MKPFSAFLTKWKSLWTLHFISCSQRTVHEQTLISQPFSSIDPPTLKMQHRVIFKCEILPSICYARLSFAKPLSKVKKFEVFRMFNLQIIAIMFIDYMKNISRISVNKSRNFFSCFIRVIHICPTGAFAVCISHQKYVFQRKSVSEPTIRIKTFHFIN